MNKTIFTTGIVFGTTAVVLGAFAAHGLKGVLTVETLESFKTGVNYQMYHALVLLIVAGISKISNRNKKQIYWTFTLGIIFFSFSIYALATNTLTPINFKPIAIITPIGGLLLISGWILLGISYFKENK